mgnify:CR=1 FL=1
MQLGCHLHCHLSHLLGLKTSPVQPEFWFLRQNFLAEMASLEGYLMTMDGLFELRTPLSPLWWTHGSKKLFSATCW